jgi:hypothetical protein
MTTSMKTFGWDTIPHFAPTWSEIEGKAAHYKTAYRRRDGKILELRGIDRFADGLALMEPAFIVRDEIGPCLMSTDQLCGFCL